MSRREAGQTKENGKYGEATGKVARHTDKPGKPVKVKMPGRPGKPVKVKMPGRPGKPAAVGKRG